jgi:hypothetical protein
MVSDQFPLSIRGKERDGKRHRLRQQDFHSGFLPMAQTRGDYTPALVFRKGNIFVQCERQNAWIPRLAGLSATTTCRTEHSDCSLSCPVMLAQMRNRALVAPMQNIKDSTSDGHFRPQNTDSANRRGWNGRKRMREQPLVRRLSRRTREPLLLSLITYPQCDLPVASPSPPARLAAS